MNLSELVEYEKVSSADFLQDYDFGTVLRQFKGIGGRDFQDRCREFIDHLVELILAHHAVTSEFM